MEKPMKTRQTLILLLSLAVLSSALFSQDIFEATRKGDLSGVKTLVEKNPQIAKAGNPGGTTPLHVAAGNRRFEIAEYLISKGADVNARNNFYTSPLHMACSNEAPVDLIRLLIEHGADVNAVAKYSGKPLDIALDTQNAEVIDYLKSKGAEPTPLNFETYRLADNLHRIAYPWGMRNNIIVFSGPEGILLIDSGFSKHAVDELRKTISGLAEGAIKYMVNTHPHGDHVDGNAVAPTEAKIVNFQSLDSPDLKNRISRSDHPLRGPAGQELAAPYVMSFNGEDIQIIPNPGLHSEADLLIYFPKSKVLCLGDLLLSQNCPALQDVTGYMSFLDKVLDIFPTGTTFVSGHGRDIDAAGFRKYRDDLAGMIAIVRKNFEAGKSAEDMIRDDVLKSYKADYSFLDWIGPDAWLQRIARGLQSAGPKNK